MVAAKPSSKQHLTEPFFLLCQNARRRAHALMKFLELSSGIAVCGAVRPQIRAMLFRAGIRTSLLRSEQAEVRR